MFIYYYTFGCKVNQYETEILKQRFSALGHAETNSPSDAELCVINSCTVTAQSDSKLRQLIKRLRRESPGAVIAVVGCYGELNKHIDGADIVLGTKDKLLLPEEYEKFRGAKIMGDELPDPISLEELSGAGRKTRGIIKVQDGCDRFCSYCVIPYARGRSRFKEPEIIRREAAALSKSGVKEAVIVGINLSDYGKGAALDLYDAVKAAAGEITRVRLGSIEPEELSDQIITKLSQIEKLCPHFHLALQSGSNRTLKRMRRKYDKEKYFTIVSRLRELFPGCAITTDIMVGFPGETEEDFAESLKTVKAIGFSDAHIFPYSRREGTAAAGYPDQVPKAVKEERARLMAEAVAESAERYRQSLIGRELNVLFEREKSPEWHGGHAENYQFVRVKRFTDTLFRELRTVRIIGADGDGLIGEIVQR